MNHLLKLGSSTILLIGFSVAQAQTNNETLGTGAGAALSTGDYNVLIGDYAGNAVSSGLNNTFVGEAAGYSTTSASDNTFIGQDAGWSNTTGQDNTFIGRNAGYSNTATDNTFIGTEAGKSNISGVDNTFVGEEAGEFNTSGRENTFIGEDAGYSNVDGDDNTAVGSSALRSNVNGKFNTAVGSEAAYDMSNTGAESAVGLAARNTVVGAAAGFDIGSGVANTMIGDNAGSNTEYGHFNTFVGHQAGTDNNRTNSQINANRNTALGAYAGYTNRDGQDNIWIGALSNSGRWTFDQTVEIAHLRGAANHWNPFVDNSNASVPNANSAIERSTVVGSQAGVQQNDGVALGYYTLTDGLGAIAIGANTESLFAGSVTIGYGATAKAADTVVIGNNSTVAWTPNSDEVTALGNSSYRFTDVVSQKATINAAMGTAAEIDLFPNGGGAYDDQWTIRAESAGSFKVSSFATGVDVDLMTIDNTGNMTVAGDVVVNSDARLKQNIETISNALAMIQELSGKAYEWKANLGRDDKQHYGFLAQDVEQVIPDVVSESDGVKSVNYQAILPILVNAMQEQQQQIEQQQQEIELLKQQITLQQSSGHQVK